MLDSLNEEFIAQEAENIKLNEQMEDLQRQLEKSNQANSDLVCQVQALSKELNRTSQSLTNIQRDYLNSMSRVRNTPSHRAQMSTKS